MQRKVTVVFLRSLSYTGTTWLNTVMGCHADAMALGPADRLWRIAQGIAPGPACLIHGKKCDFWEPFLAQYSPQNNLFVELARYSGKSVFVTNNLIQAGVGTQLEHPDVETKYIQVVRDGRHLAASYHRKFPEKAFLQSLTEFMQPSFHYFNFDEGNPDQLCLRYEEVVANQEASLDRIGKFVGLDYEPRALRFWEWRHHLTTGNRGTIALIRLGEGIPIADFDDRAFYEREFAKISSGDPYSFRDDRAERSMTPFNRFVFDCFAGDDNERFGYERDRFTADQFKEFAPILRAAVDASPLSPFFTDRAKAFLG